MCLFTVDDGIIYCQCKITFVNCCRTPRIIAAVTQLEHEANWKSLFVSHDVHACSRGLLKEAILLRLLCIQDNLLR